MHDVYTGWLEGLREIGVQAEGFNLNDRLIFYSTALMETGTKDEEGRPIVRQAMTQDQAFVMARQGLSHALYTFWPDVVLFISAFFMTAGTFDLIRQRGHKIVILHTESPYQDDEQLMRGEMADLNLINDPTNLSKFRALGPAEYQHHCYRPAVHHPRDEPLNPSTAADLSFIGTAFESRIQFFESMNLAGLDVLIAGNDWGKISPASPLAPFIGTGLGNPDCVDNTQTASIYRHSRMGLNLYRLESEEEWGGRGWAMGPREIEMAACGLPFLRDTRPEGDDILHMLPTFRNPVEASEKLRWWLKHDREREKIAEQAREAIADRTFVNSAKRLVQRLDAMFALDGRPGGRVTGGRNQELQLDA